MENFGHSTSTDCKDCGVTFTEYRDKSDNYIISNRTEHKGGVTTSDFYNKFDTDNGGEWVLSPRVPFIDFGRLDYRIVISSLVLGIILTCIFFNSMLNGQTKFPELPPNEQLYSNLEQAYINDNTGDQCHVKGIELTHVENNETGCKAVLLMFFESNVKPYYYIAQAEMFYDDDKECWDLNKTDVNLIFESDANWTRPVL